MVKLSILICTMPARQHLYGRLMDVLRPQLTQEVEVVYDNSGHSVGYKRQKLLEAATGEYIVYVDDDDLISHNYVSLILQAAESQPDCIGLRGWITTNGKDKRQWEISQRHPKWDERNGIYYRHTLHISPVKREIALKVGFKDKMHGEDYEYSMGLVPLLSSEVFIDEEIYFYLYISKK